MFFIKAGSLDFTALELVRELTMSAARAILLTLSIEIILMVRPT